MPTTYTIKNSEWHWLIVPDGSQKKYQLKYKRPTQWTDCGTFDSPEAAADAVAHGQTGQKDWDDIKHTTPFPGLSQWLIDPTGAALNPLIPAVADLLRAAILPPPQTS
jgi:hypothetical protein